MGTYKMSWQSRVRIDECLPLGQMESRIYIECAKPAQHKVCSRKQKLQKQRGGKEILNALSLDVNPCRKTGYVEMDIWIIRESREW